MFDPTFENQALDLSDLPQIDEVNFEPIEQKYVKVLHLSNSILLLIILIVFVGICYMEFGFTSSIFYFGIGIWILLFAFIWWFGSASVRAKQYAIRDLDISYRNGVFFRQWTTIPANRVQHCEITKGVIDNAFGLVELKVFTAGGSSSDLSIPGLLPEIAHRLKEHIINKIRHQDEEE